MEKKIPKNINTLQLEHHPSIHISGSVRGMKKLGYWGKSDLIIKQGQYYYNMSIWIK